MRSLNRRGLVASMEEEAIQEQIEDIQEKVEEIGDNAESLETDLVELADLAAEGDAAEADIEEGEEVVETLDDLADKTEETVEEGGLDQGGAAVLEVAVEALYDRVQLSDKSQFYRKKAAPSMEQFGTASSRVESTRYTVEAIRENAGQIWDAIVAAFKKAIEWAVQFFKQVFDLSVKYEKRASELVTKAAASSAAGGIEIKNDGVFVKLAIGADVPNDLAAALGKVSGLAKSVFSKNDSMSKAVDTLAKSLATASLKNIAESITVPMVAYGTVDAKIEGLGDGLKSTRTEVLPGNVAIVSVTPSKDVRGTAAIDLMAECRTGVEAVEEGAAKEAKALKSLDKAAAGAVAAAVVELSKEVRSYRDRQGEVTAIKKNLANVAAGFKKAAGSDDEATSNDAKAARAALSYLRANLDQPALAFSKYVLTTAKAALDLVEQSLKAGATKPAEAPAKTEEQAA